MTSRPQAPFPASPGKEGGGSSTAGTVARTIHVLAALADAEEQVGIGALADRLSLPASTVHRLLKLLADEGIVDRNPESHDYSVGAEFYRIAARIVDKVDIVRIIEPHLQRLADRFDETVLFAQYMPANHAVSFLARADGRQLLQYRIDLNRPTSLVWGASGKAVLAHLTDEKIDEVLEHAARFDAGGIAPGDGRALPDRHDLDLELKRVRERGYAISEGEKLPQARGIGVPLFGPRGILGSVTLTSPKDRMPHGEIAAIATQLIDTAQEISAELGASRKTRNAVTRQR